MTIGLIVPATKTGFTLIELMIVVAIIGILAAILVPQAASMIRSSHEAATKGNLGSIRSALSIYYGDTEGWYPTDGFASLTVLSKYLSKIPNTYVEPWHSPGNAVGAGNVAAFTASSADSTNWWSFTDPSEGQFGMALVNCIHSDHKGAVWTSY